MFSFIKISFPAVIIILFNYSLSAQDMKYTRSILDTLCSKTMFGRGYVKEGDKKAAEYIRNEFKKTRLSFFSKDGFQKLSYPVNTFPGKMEASINGKKLIPGVDFFIQAKSNTCKGTFRIVYYNVNTIKFVDSLKWFKQQNFSDKFILVDRSGTKNKDTLEILNLMRTNPMKARGLIFIDKKATWNVSTKKENFVVVSLSENLMKEKIQTISIDVETKYIEKYETQNVIAFLEGKSKPDSFIVFTAHYDHLGGIGDSLFIPGANDNASGISMLLNLASYYSKNKPEYSIAFMAFTGEEAGLLGSSYFAENPLFPLNKIKILFNLDLVGTGDDGMMLVNGAVFKKEFEQIKNLNDKKNYLPKVNMRGEAANSDHYPFYKNGVICFFIYTQGGISEYHNPFDKAETLPLTKYKELFSLLTDYVEMLQAK